MDDDVIRIESIDQITGPGRYAPALYPLEVCGIVTVGTELDPNDDWQFCVSFDGLTIMKGWQGPRLWKKIENVRKFIIDSAVKGKISSRHTAMNDCWLGLVSRSARPEGKRSRR